MKTIFYALLACVVSMAPPTLHAKDGYPSRPVRLIVPFTPGGIGDVVARIIGTSISEQLGQPVIVENRPGAGGVLGTEFAIKAEPDGYTILQVSSPQIINQALRAKPSYDLMRDFAPVTQAVRAPLVLVVPASTSTKSVSDLAALAKSKPQGLDYGSGGVGSVGHLSGELLKRSIDISATHIPYKGNSGVIPDLIGGRLDFFFSSQPEAVAGVGHGAMRALAVTAPKRVPTFPDVPTMVELGYTDFTPSSVYGYMVPAKTPPEVVKKLHDVIAKAIALPATQERFATLGLNPETGSPEDWGATLKSELDRWHQVAEKANISLD